MPRSIATLRVVRARTAWCAAGMAPAVRTAGASIWAAGLAIGATDVVRNAGSPTALLAIGATGRATEAVVRTARGLLATRLQARLIRRTIDLPVSAALERQDALALATARAVKADIWHVVHAASGDLDAGVTTALLARLTASSSAALQRIGTVGAPGAVAQVGIHALVALAILALASLVGAIVAHTTLPGYAAS